MTDPKHCIICGKEVNNGHNRYCVICGNQMTKVVEVKTLLLNMEITHCDNAGYIKCYRELSPESQDGIAWQIAKIIEGMRQRKPNFKSGLGAVSGLELICKLIIKEELPRYEINQS